MRSRRSDGKRRHRSPTLRILAIDTALGACSACVLDRTAHEPVASESILLERGHAEALVPLIGRVLERVEGGIASIDRIAVTVGPGSFTGLRVGLSSARAAGLARGVPVVGVTTLSAFLAPWLSASPGRVVAAAIDARHGQVYVQAVAPGGRPLYPPRISPLRDAVRTLGSGPVNVAGAAATLLAAEARLIGLEATILDASPAPDIRWVARLGLATDPGSAPPRPLYLKAPDAQPQAHKHLPRADRPVA